MSKKRHGKNKQKIPFWVKLVGAVILGNAIAGPLGVFIGSILVFFYCD